MRGFLKENPDLYERIKLLVFKHYGIGNFAPEEEVKAEPAKPEAARVELAVEQEVVDVIGGEQANL